MKFFVSAFTFLALIAGCTAAAELSPPEIYLENCAGCHGLGSDGGSAPSLIDGEWKHGNDLESIKANIAFGIDEGGMPGFDGALTEEQISVLANYLLQGDPSALKTDLSKTPAIDKVTSITDQVVMEDYVTRLNEPWGFVFLDMDDLLVTEKSGRLLYVSHFPKPIEIQNIPSVNDSGQGGLLDVALDPDYAQNKWVYLTYSHPLLGDEDKAMTRLIRGRIKDFTWTDEEVLFEAKAEHYIKARQHYGSRITFDHAGHLYFSIGDRGQKYVAQNISMPNGKIHRLNRDGSVPPDNPFRFKDYPSIYSFGNRNPQGLVWHDASGVLWETEHGPKGGDELNFIQSGKNYGWPEISYGRNYSGTELTPFVAKPGMEQPASHWTPSIAVCGLDVYTGDLFPSWKGRLLAGSLKSQSLRLIEVEGTKYIGEAEILKDKGRIRDVTTGPDGAIYVALPTKIVRLSPAND